jgi:MFS family permease
LSNNLDVAAGALVRSPGALVAACCLAMLSIGFATNTPALCLTAIAGDLNLDSVRSGLFLSCAFWGLVISIPVSGPLADRCGFRYLLVASAALQSSGILLVSHAREMWPACVGAGITGLGTGIVDALLTPLACAAYPRSAPRSPTCCTPSIPSGCSWSC